MADQTALDWGLARGVVAFRWLALAGAWVGLAIGRDELSHAAGAVAGLGVATAVTAAATVWLGRTPSMPRWLVAVEVAAASFVLVLDGLVFEAGRSQSLPWAWPTAAVIAAAIVGGTRWGIVAAAVVAVASFTGETLVRDSLWWTAAALSKTGLFALAAVGSSLVADRLREAEIEISTVRAREEMARVLHDGVLQTLAVIQRRSDDPELTSLAQDQERDLRAYLFGRGPDPSSLRQSLAESVARVQRRHDLLVELIVAPDVREPAAADVHAVAGAVGEALENVAKHSEADRATVYVEPAESSAGIVCFVRDNGVGFEPESVRYGEGIQRSITARMADVGGGAEITSRPSKGTEVRLWTT